MPSRSAFPGPALRRAATLLLALVSFVACNAGDPVERVRQLHARGEYAESLEPLRELLADDPEDGELNFLYGRALIAIGEFGAATFPLRDAMEDPEWRRPAALERVRPALASNDFNEVVDVTTRLLEDDPDDAVALLFRAQAHAYWKKDLPAAVEDARRVLELEPGRLEAYEPLVIALQGLERGEEAKEEFAEAGRRLRDTDAPESLLAWHCSSSAAFAAEAGEVEEAREGFEGCLETYPADPTLVRDAVEFFDAQGDFERSLAVMRAAHDAAENPAPFRLGLALRLARAGEREEGEALVRAATETEDPHRAHAAWLEVASFLSQQRDYAGAAEAYESGIERIEAVEDAPPQTLFQWADALVSSQQLDRALDVADRIAVPAHRELILGRVAQERGEHAEALEHYDAALSVWPSNARARYYAALAAEHVGDLDRALEEYRYSVRIDAAATDARTRAARLLVAQGDLRRAYQIQFIEAGSKPLGPEEILYSTYLIARAANPAQLQDALMRVLREHPRLYPEALMRGAEGAFEVAGADGALSLLAGAPGIDLRAPRSAPVLIALVRYAHQAGKPEQAQRAVSAAIGAQPELPAFQEALGLHLELSREDPAAAEAAYQRALEDDPSRAGALMGLARLKLESDLAGAAELFVRAYEADPSEALPQLAVARILLALGREKEAAERLEVILERHPLEAEAAERRAEIDLAREEVSEQTLAWAIRATRLMGDADDYERLSRVHEALGNPERAARAASRAEVLREAAAALRERAEG